MPTPSLTSSARSSGHPPDGSLQRRLEFLDALRGIAALVVVLQHLPRREPPLYDWINPGRIGVIAFFAISGFVIPLSLARVREPGGFASFWIGRAFRILPVYWASLAASAVAGTAPKASASDWIANILLLQLPLGRVEINAVAWTLVIEIFLYLVLSLAALRRDFLERPVRDVALALGSLALVGVVAPLILEHRAPAGAIQCLATAAIGSTWFVRHRKRIGLRSAWLLTFAALAVSIGSGYVGTEIFVKGRGEINLSFAAVANGTALGISLFLAAYALRSAKMPRLLLGMGAISYPWYLFHGFTLPFAWREESPLAGLVALVGGILIACLVRVAVEIPANAIGRRWREQIASRP